MDDPISPSAKESQNVGFKDTDAGLHWLAKIRQEQNVSKLDFWHPKE